MAQDQVEIMEKLGYREFFVAGHDRGARTVHRMCLDHPERVKRAAVIDILPNYHIWTHASKNWALKSWHWLFMAQPYDMPERMMAGVPAQWFMEKKLSKPGIGLGFFDPEAFAEYVRCFNWKTIRGSCEDYRACPTCDFEMDEADRKAGRKVALRCWSCGAQRAIPARSTATCSRSGGTTRPTVTGGPIDCGHYVPEEAPDETLRWLLRHFGEGSSPSPTKPWRACSPPAVRARSF